MAKRIIGILLYKFLKYALISIVLLPLFFNIYTLIKYGVISDPLQLNTYKYIYKNYYNYIPIIFISLVIISFLYNVMKTKKSPLFWIKAYLLPYSFNFYAQIKKKKNGENKVNSYIFDKMKKMTKDYIIYKNPIKINYDNYYKALEDIKQYLQVEFIRVERYGSKGIKLYINNPVKSFQFNEKYYKKGKIYIGKSLENKDIYISLKDLTHILIAGQSGAGKSVFQNLLIANFIYNLDNLDYLFLVDLKGGVEFFEYSKKDKKIKVITKVQSLLDFTNKLIQIMEKRYLYMRKNNIKNWNGKQIIVMFDEFASINDQATLLEKKEYQQLLKNLRTLLAKARASGIKFFIATQKATSDSIDTTLRENLQTKILMRTISKEAQRAVLGDNEIIESLGLNPADFGKGQFIIRSDTIQTIVQSPYIC
ncbi:MULTISPECIES: FtsK/SpoIIIE domain-containing protein [unclassified Nitratiruptor]|uniref:FtsK/SpoIIIE domain-containing protein n=1 Tax=unclassified Nitratiruptor TaxID=2624044 RepID=UPI001916BE4A|nr:MULTISPECIES: FtsK/SpoIIIE domain-containing protein [unclassified Nitratiruptor]BCD59708.1 hypothetical protein NitYY0810_C0460 [Nitratiruptor sp. YY08-10]BCD63632.1 hypothetical protein NitYY0814_C0460 [Nitratiruptor sp. YY08-14]